jgi:Na+/H+ antiporter NhaD/arsenite permease-like protein
VIVGLRYLTPRQAWEQYIDYNTLGLLAGMMMIVAIMRKSGVFQFVAIKLAKLSKGNIWLIFIFLMLMIACMSAVLDNITTVLLVGPILLLIADGLGINPIPLLIGSIMAANLGGASTLIGDPPNMLIATSSGLSFVSFLANMAPVVAILLALTVLLLWVVSRKRLRSRAPKGLSILTFDESKAVTDWPLLRKSLSVFSLTVIFFVLHPLLHLSPSVVAIAGAVLLLFISGIKPEEVFRDIQWSSLLFIVGLFVVVGALDEQGLMSSFASSIVSMADQLPAVALIILWMSFVASALLSSIPTAAAMIPLIRHLGMQMSLLPQEMIPLWWALALGVAIGGSSTLLGGISNIVVAGMSERLGRADARLTYWRYGRIAVPMMLACLFVATFYLYLRYFIRW